jgi:copper(I)-binding protein
VAKATEIHETVMVQADSTDSSMTAGTSGAPVMEMRPVARIEVPPRSSVVFKPGGYHMMLMELSKPLQLGSSFQLTLTFERAGDKVVTVDVRDVAP